MKKRPDTKNQNSAKPETKPETKGQGSQPAPPPPEQSPSPESSGFYFNYRWFTSKTVRHATAMRKHVRRLINSQRDLLSAEAIREMDKAVNALNQAIYTGADKSQLEAKMTELENAANQWLRPYPNPGLRENIEVLLVALAVAMGIRTFFIQPFKIPTGSMQPTLFGVTSESLLNRPDFTIPSGWHRFKEWCEGASYIHVVAKNDGELEISPPVKLLIFNIYQQIKIGGRSHGVWFPPDYGQATLEQRTGIQSGMQVKAGEEVVKLKVIAGDYLFVNRMTYNFRRPERGEIIVFETRGIDEDARFQFKIPGDQFYIKRLVGLGGECLQIKKDSVGRKELYHLVVNGTNLDASTHGFENVYGGQEVSVTGNKYEYVGHAPLGLFANGREVTVSPGRLMVMGDNTMNSQDSRYFGDFDEHAVIGKSWFVYWPLSSRFGLGYR
jgi:signal peptidase I